MNNNKNTYSSNGAGEIGCLILIGLFSLPYILENILIAIIPYLMLGGVGFMIYRLLVYDSRTGKITAKLEETFNMNPEDEGENILELPSKEQDLGNTQLLASIKDELDKHKDVLLLESGKQVEQSLKKQEEKITRQKKNEVINKIFGEPSSDVSYARTDEFERQEHEKKVQKKTDELDKVEFQLGVQKEIFEQHKKIHEVQIEGERERYKIREEMAKGFLRVGEMFQEFSKRLTTIEGDFAAFKGYVAEKFTSLELKLSKEIANNRELIGQLRIDVKEEFVNVKQQFGKEILRLDKQQLTIVDRLQKFENQIKAFSIDMGKLRNEAERFSIRGEKLFAKAEILNARHSVLIEKTSNELNLGLKTIAVHKESFANSVGAAKLKMEEISNDQYFALKDMAYERVGIEMMRQDHTQRVALETEKMNGLIKDKKSIENNIQLRLSMGRETEGLRHQLHMTQENLNYTQNRANLMRQESNIVHKLSQ